VHCQLAARRKSRARHWVIHGSSFGLPLIQIVQAVQNVQIVGQFGIRFERLERLERFERVALCP
jgi:hypothetical protein